jgi:hypothetical protein
MLDWALAKLLWAMIDRQSAMMRRKDDRIRNLEKELKLSREK